MPRGPVLLFTSNVNSFKRRAVQEFQALKLVQVSYNVVHSVKRKSLQPHLELYDKPMPCKRLVFLKLYSNTSQQFITHYLFTILQSQPPLRSTNIV